MVRSISLVVVAALALSSVGCRARSKRSADIDTAAAEPAQLSGAIGARRTRYKLGVPRPLGRPATDPASPQGPSVDANGRPSVEADGPRVYAKARFTWIRRRPDTESEWIGYLTIGESVVVRERGARLRQGEGAPSAKAACSEWVAVAPEGYVCIGESATLDANDPTLALLDAHAVNNDSPWPYEYARSVGAPRYRGLPSARDERAREGDVETLRKHIDQARLVANDDDIKAIDPRLVGVELGATGNAAPALFVPPPSVLESDADVALGSTIAFPYEFDHHGRSWLLTWDKGVVPEVRVKKYPHSNFHGVELSKTGDTSGDTSTDREPSHGVLVAFTQKKPAPRYRVDATTVRLDGAFDPQSAIELGAGEPIERDGKRYRETATEGVYVAEGDVILVAPQGVPPRGLPREGRQTWVEVSTVGGWLVAFEGDTPVYATLISAGRARMLDEAHMAPTSSTPTGSYTILTKLRTATMRSDARPDNVHAEVMYTQVFHEGYALHGAYWHDAWGDRKSAGCVNLSPIDSKWLFDWSEPRIPSGWHARHTQPGDAATWVVVHE